MKFNNLGRTGVKVSQLCLGCMNFGGRTNSADATEQVSLVNQETLPRGSTAVNRGGKPCGQKRR